jgi:transposase
MGQKSGTGKAPVEQVIKDIRRATRKQYGAEEKIRIVLEGLRGEESTCGTQGQGLRPATSPVRGMSSI